MKFTLHFGNNTFPDMAGAIRMVKIAEAAGFDSVVTVDHVVFPHQYTSVYPYGPDGRLPGGPGGSLPDPLIWMAAMAAVTTKLRFMTGVIILPLRNPFVLAKQVATLDHMSGGRIELGIGVGWLKEEFEAVGVPFEKRGPRSDEYIAVMRKLWAEDGASFDGQFVKFDQVSSNPKPVRRSVPIVIGGHSEAAAKRAGRLGDGFFPSIGAQVDTVPLFDVVRRTAAAAGRDPQSVEIMAGCPDLLPGSKADPRAAIEARAQQGVSRIVLPVFRWMPDLEEGLGRFGETVVRPFASL
ncbi:MAG TPA: LLM class F420-dependent oxidoreductase [Reyranella sp.]|nr:LLM class F420-dependent oxidoreductase [Reyranella sp.]